MVRELACLFGETLFHLPASSVAVEKLHANTQLNCTARGGGRKPEVIQQNSYLMSTFLEFSALKAQVEAETIGHRARASRLLSSRVVSHTMPSRPVTHFKQQPINPRRVKRTVANFGGVPPLLYFCLAFVCNLKLETFRGFKLVLSENGKQNSD